MRYGIWTAAVLGAAWAAGPACAQTGGVSPSTILGGPPPSAIIQKPIDLSHVIAPAPAMAAQQNRFNFSALFSKLIIPGYPVKRGVSPLPPPSAFPTYPDFKLVGLPPFLLGDPQLTDSPFQPVLPIIPDVRTPVGPGSK